MQFTHDSTERITDARCSPDCVINMDALQSITFVEPGIFKVFICATSLLGAAIYPDCDNQGNHRWCMVNYGSLPGGNIGRYNQGDTLTHELGHYVGMAHTFSEGCSGMGDEVADTNAEEEPHYGCPDSQVGLRETCGSTDP